MKTSVLKPGYLVSLRSNMRGGVSYSRVDIEQDHTTEEGARRAKWETLRNIPDPQEFEAATKARAAARAAVVAECCQSAFGLLCPTSNEGALFAAITTAREIADTFNEGARLSQIDVYVLVGRIAQDDAEAARAIGAELRELMEAMQAGIAAADPAAIREAANKARALGAMLTEGTAGKVSEAISQARKVARQLVARVEKAGESAALVVAQCNVEAIERARFAFLDLDAGEVQAVAPAGRGIDLEPGAQGAAAPAGEPRALELV